MEEDKVCKPLTPEEERQELIVFFANRSGVIKKEQERTARDFLSKIGSREVPEPTGYQKVKK